MQLRFYKYQGTGNDFVVIDDRDESFDPADNVRIHRLCHRRFGIGADGLILLRDHPDMDFEMLFFNADGHPTSLCGNGSRCAVHFANFLGLVHDKTRFQTSEGPLDAFIQDELIHIKMPDVHRIQDKDSAIFMDTGSPHHVCFVGEHLESFDVFRAGQEIRYSADYKAEGTNVNFVEARAKNELFVRTYERGVENETLSCGTGVTAAALAYGLDKGSSPIKIRTLGGDLTIRFTRTGPKEFKDIYLIGPAEMVFEGLTKL